MTDIKEIDALLLARHFQEELFSDLPGKRQEQKGGRETLVGFLSARRPATSPTAARS